MDNKKYYLAIDLGATSGRHIVAYKENGELVLKEIHRFVTRMDESENGLVWNIPRLLKEIKIGIKKAIDEYKNIESMSIDTWGVDYVLMNKDKEILPYYAYRNERNLIASEKLHKVIPFKELYERTGIQYAPFNTIYQLYGDLLDGRLDEATDYLMLPSYFVYKLTGVKTHEYTNESTGALLDAKSKDYDLSLIEKAGLPTSLFGEINEPGTFVGYFTDEVAKEVGGNMKVVLCGTHDTASAFEAVDCPEDAVIISCGTWSLLGAKIKQPMISEESLKANFTNEGGVGYIRYLKNLMGMWLANEVCRQKDLNVVEVCSQLDGIKYHEIFNVNDPSLAAPKDMSVAITNLLKKNPPKNDLELFASIYHSLAYASDVAVKELESTLGRKFKYVYLVGGGAKNKYLVKLTEKYCDKKVVALPIEATSIGNIKMQMKTSKE